MKKYIDCDGVIIDTEKNLFDDYDEKKRINPNLTILYYLQSLDWVKKLNEVNEINDALYYLRNYDPSCAEILTKVHSLNEAKAKINYFKSKKIENKIIFVPYYLQKSCVVNTNGSVLLDDSLNNLRDWSQKNGIPFMFNNDDTEFACVHTLDELLDDEIFNNKTIKLIKK